MAIREDLAYQHLRERILLLEKLVGKDLNIQIPNHPGYQRMVYAWSVFGFGSNGIMVRSFDGLASSRTAVGLMVSVFDIDGNPQPRSQSQHLTVFGYEGEVLARVRPIIYPE